MKKTLAGNPFSQSQHCIPARCRIDDFFFEITILPSWKIVAWSKPNAYGILLEASFISFQISTRWIWCIGISLRLSASQRTSALQLSTLLFEDTILISWNINTSFNFNGQKGTEGAASDSIECSPVRERVEKMSTESATSFWEINYEILKNYIIFNNSLGNKPCRKASRQGSRRIPIMLQKW